MRTAAREIGASAEANLAEHCHSGDAKIEVIYGTDAHVSLVDEAALSI